MLNKMPILKKTLNYISKDTQPASIVGVLFIFILIGTTIDSIVSLGVQIPKSPVNAIDYWFERYQFLIAGILAISAGYFTVHSARMQILHLENTRRSEIEIRSKLNIIRLIENLYFIRKYITSIRASFTLKSANIAPSPMTTFDRDLIRDTISQQTYELPPEIKLRTMYFPFAISVFESFNQKIKLYHKPNEEQIMLIKLRNDLLSTMVLSCEIQITHAKMMLSMGSNANYCDKINSIDRTTLNFLAEKWDVELTIANNLMAELGINIRE